MLWLKDGNKLTVNFLKMEKEKLEELKSSIKQSDNIIDTVVGVPETQKYPKFINGIHGLYYSHDVVENVTKLCYNPCFFCRHILESMSKATHMYDSIELISLLSGCGNSDITHINDLVENYNGTLNSLLYDLSSDLWYFSKQLLPNISIELDREISIDKIDEVKRLSSELGISDLGKEYEDLERKVTIANLNSEVLTLSRKIHEKLK